MQLTTGALVDAEMSGNGVGLSRGQDIKIIQHPSGYEWIIGLSKYLTGTSPDLTGRKYLTRTWKLLTGPHRDLTRPHRT